MPWDETTWNNTNRSAPLFFRPAFREVVWGGKRLGSDYAYAIPSDHTGECWAISAHPNGECTVDGGAFDGMTLSRLWKERPEIFGNYGSDKFPLLVKMIDAREDLSIQVHPDDNYVKKYSEELSGKTECWYILDCPDDAELIIGHRAKKRSELRTMIEEGRWDELLRRIPVRKGDFIQIEPGTIHAIKSNIMVLEIQQNSDITYRMYDYDRIVDGKKRELHLKQCEECVTVPSGPVEGLVQDTSTLPANVMNELISCDYYRVWELKVNGKVDLEQSYPFLVVSIVDGEGTMNGLALRRGDHFILPCGFGKAEFEGTCSLILCTV